MAQAFVIRRDPRGAQVHVRRRDTGECVGCVEAGLYEIVRAIVEEEVAARAREGIFPAGAATEEMVLR